MSNSDSKSIKEIIMKRIIIAFTLLPLLFAACKRDITSINVDPKNPQIAPASAFISNAQKAVADAMTSTNVNDNIFRLVVQYWQETTYTDESNFDLNTRQIPRQLWNYLYRDVIRDLREAKKLIPGQISVASTQKNALAIAEVTEIYAWYYLVTTFGDIPYSQALDASNSQPKYDNQQTVYNDLLTRLDAAIASMVTTGESIGDADLIYNGDMVMWKKFANSLKLKMGMTIADADNAKAKSTVESAVASGVFTSSADDATFGYLTAPPNTNPVWVDLVQSGRKDFVAASTIVNKLTALNDPRRDDYFTVDAVGGYSGGTPGASSNYSTFSKPDEAIQEPDAPADLLSYVEVEFFLAEAVERGYAVGGTAATHYNNAVTASILEWGGTAAEAIAYLAQPAVNYATAAGTYKPKIGEQKWIALYNRGWDAWIEWRRLDYPALVKPPTALTDIPKRLTYPIPEQNLNTANYTAAATAIGGDLVTTKLFWDKF
jgi:hypothetical protein